MAASEPDELFHGVAPQIDHRLFIEEMNRMTDEQDGVLHTAALAEVTAARFQHELAATPHHARARQDEPRTPPQQLSGELVERLSKFMAQVEKDRVEDGLRARDLEARALEATSLARAGRAAAESARRLALVAAVVAVIAVILALAL